METKDKTLNVVFKKWVSGFLFYVITLIRLKNEMYKKKHTYKKLFFNHCKSPYKISHVKDLHFKHKAMQIKAMKTKGLHQ